MFTEQEKEIIEWGKQNGKSATEVKQAVAKYRQATGYVPTPVIPQAQPQKGFFGRVIDQNSASLDDRVTEYDQELARYKSGQQGALETGVQVAGTALATGVLDPVKAITMNIPGVKPTMGVIGKGINYLATAKYSPMRMLGNWIGNKSERLQEAVQLYDTDPQFRQTVNSATNIITAALTTKGLIEGGTAITEKGVDLTKQGIESTKGAYQAARQSVLEPIDDVSRATVERHLTSSKQVLDNIDEASLSANGGESALVKSTHNNLTMGLRGEGRGVIADRIAQLNPDDYPTLQAYTDAVNQVTGQGSVRSVIEKVSTRFGGKPKDLEGTVGEVIQGKPEDIKKAIEAFKKIDTSKVKTYEDLVSASDDSVKNLSEKLDDVLGSDTKRYTPTDAAVQKNVGQATVTTTPVDDALDQLLEFYKKINNSAKAEEIQQIIDKYNAEGLTRQEMNNIAKLHGRDLSGYNQNGELASGLTKQAAENTRRGVKEAVRQGLPDDTAAVLDKEMSNVIATRDLAETMVEKVALLEQKIAERGLLEKVGYNIAKYGNVITGGSIRGIVGGLLPRGVGYKVMNALDLEERLRSNLKLIEQALKAGSEAELISAVENLVKKP